MAISNNKGWSIAVIGGGPAGSATALSLQQSLSNANWKSSSPCQIHIFDDNVTQNIRIGETIPPVATEVLNRLGIVHLLENSTEHIECPGSISQWNSDTPDHNDFFLDLEGKGYHLNRKLFDAQLLEQSINSGCKLHAGWRLNNTEYINHQWQLRFQNNRCQQEIFNADFVIDATGKSSAFCRRLNICRNVCDEVIFLCAIVNLSESEHLLPHTFVESVPEGWWYAARLPQNRMIVTLCTDIESIKSNHWDKPDRWLKLLKETSWLQRNIPRTLLSMPADDIVILKEFAPSSLLSAVYGTDWLAVGDAASSCDPITSAGITKALIQGEQAGKAIASLIINKNDDALQQYQQQVFADFSQYISVRNMLYQSEQRFRDTPFWRRRYGMPVLEEPQV